MYLVSSMKYSIFQPLTMSDQNVDIVRTSNLSSTWRNSHTAIRSYVPSVKDRNDSQMGYDRGIRSYLPGGTAFKLYE